MTTDNGLSREDAAILRKAYAAGIALVLPHSVKKALQCHKLFIDAIGNEALTDSDFRRELHLRDSKQIIEHYLFILDDELARWLNGDAYFLTDRFIRFDLKSYASFLQSEAFANLERLAKEVRAICPDGKLPVIEAAVVRATIKNGMRVELIR